MNVLSIFLTIGLPAIDESLDKLLVAMETFPNVAVLGDAVGLARVIGLLLALCVGSYECWMMILGRRGMDRGRSMIRSNCAWERMRPKASIPRPKHSGCIPNCNRT